MSISGVNAAASAGPSYYAGPPGLRTAEGPYLAAPVTRIYTPPPGAQTRIMLPPGRYDAAPDFARVPRRNDDGEVVAGVAASILVLAAGGGAIGGALRRRKAKNAASPRASAGATRGIMQPGGQPSSPPASATLHGPSSPPPPDTIRATGVPLAMRDADDVVHLDRATGPAEVERVRDLLGVQQAQDDSRCSQHVTAALLNLPGAVTNANYDARTAVARGANVSDSSVRAEGGSAAVTFHEHVAIHNTYANELHATGQASDAAHPLAGFVMTADDSTPSLFRGEDLNPIVVLSDSAIAAVGRDAMDYEQNDKLRFPTIRDFAQPTFDGEGSIGAPKVRLQEIFHEASTRFSVHHQPLKFALDAEARAQSSLGGQSNNATLGETHFVAVAHRGGAWRVVDSLKYHDGDPQPLLLEENGRTIRARGKEGAARALRAYLALYERTHGTASYPVRVATPHPPQAFVARP